LLPTYSLRTNPRLSLDNLYTLNTLKISNVIIDTPTNSYTRGTISCANKPNVYYSNCNKFKA
jgi:hypothetical protein